MKKLLTSGSVCLLLAASVAVISGCNKSSLKQSESGAIYYTRYNFHYYFSGRGDDMIASIVNYVNCPNHGFMPYNTKVKIGRYKKGFELKIVDIDGVILVNAPKKYLGTKTLEEYLDLILSRTPVSYADLSEIDKKGVSSGEPRIGMSKKGVRVALGYPAPSFTPNLESDVWHYWNSRFKKCDVLFKDDIVEYIGSKGRRILEIEIDRENGEDTTININR